MIWVVNAKKVAGKYEIQLEFNNGLIGVLDFRKILENDHRTIIRELLNEDMFNTFSVAYDTLCWENGVDFAPDYLYEQVLTHKQVA
ncbi:MAG: DUF2442 domain-containing protein [Candidatus Symbiothrix sp.]|jgi:hypothetical protein|nr:DUF2442 domain-containing protein [Candidatus Symbiothrix sp.]